MPNLIVSASVFNIGTIIRVVRCDEGIDHTEIEDVWTDAEELSVAGSADSFGNAGRFLLWFHDDLQ